MVVGIGVGGVGEDKTYREKSQIHKHENQISLPLEIGDQCGTDHGDEEIPQPICRDSDGISCKS